MAEGAHFAQTSSAAKTASIVRELLRDYRPRDFAIEFWDGTRWEPERSNFRRFTWRIKNSNALRAALRSDREVALGEAYIHDDFDISGDILAIFPVAEYLAEKHLKTGSKLRLASLLLPLLHEPHSAPQSSHLHGGIHTKGRDREAVMFHYDLSNDFYKLWLDAEMVYSCGYFRSAHQTVDQAQQQKLDYICRKLRLKAGERLLDIGCGWGGLVMHAAREYGVQAIGITLSEQQRALAQEGIEKAGLSARCEVRLLDYRDAAQLSEFDKVVSVGMVEHVGEHNLPEYFRTAYHLLKPGGVFLNHGIARAGNREKPEEPTFTDVYVFPDGELVPIATTLRHAENTGFEVRDVEDLREHYFLTLCKWLGRLEAHADEARAMIGEVKYRTWRLYLAGSAYYFQRGKLCLYQSLLAKNTDGQTRLPLTREDWYS